MRKNEKKQTVNPVQLIRCVLIGGVISLTICIVVLFLCSIGISNGWINNRTMLQYIIICCLIGGFGGATFSVLHVRTKTLLVGFLTSCIQFVLIMLIGFLMFPVISPSEHGASIASGCLIGGILAGFLGGKPKKKRRK